MVTVMCDGPYCSRSWDPDDTDAKEWKAITVDISRDPNSCDVSMCIWPLNPDHLRAADRAACPRHWRQVAEKVGNQIEWFPVPAADPHTGEEQAAPATPPDPDPQF